MILTPFLVRYIIDSDTCSEPTLILVTEVIFGLQLAKDLP